MAPVYSYKDHRRYPQVGNRGRGQDFGVVGLERPNGPSETYHYILAFDSTVIPKVPRNRRIRKTKFVGDDIVKMRRQQLRPPSTPQPRAMRSNLARQVHPQEHAHDDRPSADVDRVVSSPLQPCSHTPSLMHQSILSISPSINAPHSYMYPRPVRSAYSPATPPFQDLLLPPRGEPTPSTKVVDHYAMLRESNPVMVDSGVAVQQQCLSSISVAHPTCVYTNPAQSAYSPATPLFQELLLPPCDQSAPDTMAVGHYAMSRGANSATSSTLISSSVRPPPVANIYQGILDASSSVPNHLHQICDTAPPMMKTGHQLHNCSGVLDYPPMPFDVVTPPPQAQSIYCSPDAIGTQAYQVPHMFEESDVLQCDTYQAFMQAGHCSPAQGPLPTDLIASQYYGCELPVDALQSFALQTPRYTAAWGHPTPSQVCSRLSPSSRQRLAECIEAMTGWSRHTQSIDSIKNNRAPPLTQQSSHHSHLVPPIQYISSHTSSSDMMPPQNPSSVINLTSRPTRIPAVAHLLHNLHQ
ncbi:hypothetical protein A0H81_13145 [Grifola frondosa]|uniref:Uncharacterized protein n=1 Tax=Grifola frondosa TaxID=5627 RepID=A0A1C7LS62_GRIFR|nr:hypothetical protein A0H81_13145 [Grifola frondosa]